MAKKPSDPDYPGEEIERRREATLKRLLATPPDHKRAAKPDASPKKRGRPPKAGASQKE